MLPVDYYQNEDVLYLSRDLLGKFLVTTIDGIKTSGMIVETEAYRAPEDRASHACGNRRTRRNATMFAAGGVSYVYLCYGIHSLFNVVTNRKDIPHAILVRAIQPEEGLETMLLRRQKKENAPSLTAGPGALAQALGITTKHNGLPLDGNSIGIEDRGVHVAPKEIVTGPRIGVGYAGNDASLPWRFCLKGNRWLSAGGCK